jgi:hypothetical protein
MPDRRLGRCTSCPRFTYDLKRHEKFGPLCRDCFLVALQFESLPKPGASRKSRLEIAQQLRRLTLQLQERVGDQARRTGNGKAL